MSEQQPVYTVTATRKKATVQNGADKYSPEHELAMGLRRLLLSAARLIEIYAERKWG